MKKIFFLSLVPVLVFSSCKKVSSLENQDEVSPEIEIINTSQSLIDFDTTAHESAYGIFLFKGVDLDDARSFYSSMNFKSNVKAFDQTDGDLSSFVKDSIEYLTTNFVPNDLALRSLVQRYAEQFFPSFNNLVIQDKEEVLNDYMRKISGAWKMRVRFSVVDSGGNKTTEYINFYGLVWD